MNLNTAQEQAVKKINGPLLIIAGAGSGKTATLTARIQYMIEQGNIPPIHILAVTFTNKAAREMKQRVAKVLWSEYQINPYRNTHLPTIWTFHSIGVMMLKEKIHTLWYDKNFVIYDESDKLSILKNIIKEDLKLDEKKYPARSIASFISNAKNALISHKNYHNYVDSHIKEIVAEVYKIYTQRLDENNALDFDDILVKTLEILQIPENLEYYQNKWTHLMIDEYQDTNAPQYEIVKLLASKLRNLAVVWDDWQSIYSWRGADMRNILNFQKDYPEALVIKLEQNYRSTKYIIDTANAIIKNNKTALEKTLFTQNDQWEKIFTIEASDDRIESKTIANIIKEKGIPYSQNLILYRTNGQSRSIEEALIMQGIPYKVIWGLKFYDRKEIKDMLAYLRAIHNPNDIVAIKRIINTPSRKIGATTLKKLDEYKQAFWVSFTQIFENISEVDGLNAGAKNSIILFYTLLQELIEDSKQMEVSELLENIIKKIWYEEYLRDDATKDEFDAKIDNIRELKNVTSTYNGMDPRESLSQFLEEVSLITDMDHKEKEEKTDFVTLMTIHTSKWLEYERVFLTGLEDGLFPSSRTFTDLKELEEERRLMYVAVTRAKKELYLSRAIERFQYGDYIRNPPSRFFKEIPEDFLQEYDMWNFPNPFFTNSYGITNPEPTFRIKKTIIENDITDFHVGDKLSHPKFWIGTIIALSWDLAEISFVWQWVKKMNIKIAPVKKI